MVGGNFGFRGNEALIKGLKERAKLDDVKNVVRLNGTELQRRMQREASFKGHYRGKKFIKPTGTTKRSIGLSSPLGDRGFGARVSPNTYYSYWLEHGTRFMSAQPFVQPAFLVQKVQFIKDLERLMK
ncbi:hypothetical protein JYK21_07950 [Ralstonia pickettii]|nr:hypothetical protein [Ralstonia pickettii]